MVAQGQNIDEYLESADALSMYEGAEGAALGGGVEVPLGYTSPEYGMGDGDGAAFSMPDFVQQGDGDGNLTSAELTAQLLEPEQAALDDMSAQELAAEDRREIVTGEIDTTPVEPSENGTSDEK
jgi:hypothetical protein